MSGCKSLERAPRLLGRGLDGRQPFREHLRRNGVGEPAVSEARGAFQRGLLAAAAPDRRPPWLARRRRHAYVLELVKAPAVGDRFAGPQLADDLDRLAEPRPALVDGHAAALVLLGELAADTDA